VTGLIVSPNKTSQGIYAAQVWEGSKPGYRAMHEAVFEAGWDAEELVLRHRELIAPEHPADEARLRVLSQYSPI
jgi:hypothetical protein